MQMLKTAYLDTKEMYKIKNISMNAKIRYYKTTAKNAALCTTETTALRRHGTEQRTKFVGKTLGTKRGADRSRDKL